MHGTPDPRNNPHGDDQKPDSPDKYRNEDAEQKAPDQPDHTEGRKDRDPEKDYAHRRDGEQGA